MVGKIVSNDPQTPLFDEGVDPKEQGVDLLWSQVQRFAFIEFRLYWEGRVNRPALQKMFLISEAQATDDFTDYKKRAPGNMEYIPKERAYIRLPTFAPKFSTPTAKRYLAHLRLIQDGIERPSPNWIGDLPSRDMAPNLRRRLRPEVLRDVIHAIKDNAALEVQYRSFNRPAPHSRWISPHSVVFDGRRWHVRAFCHLDNDFRDFVFARIDNVRGSKPSPVNRSLDLRWTTELTLELAPNPYLTDEQKEIVRLEYQMENDDCIRLTTRASMFFYIKEYFLLNIQPKPENAMSVHLHLRNENSVMSELARIDENAKYELSTASYQIE